MLKYVFFARKTKLRVLRFFSEFQKGGDVLRIEIVANVGAAAGF